MRIALIPRHKAAPDRVVLQRVMAHVFGSP